MKDIMQAKKNWIDFCVTSVRDILSEAVLKSMVEKHEKLHCFHYYSDFIFVVFIIRFNETKYNILSTDLVSWNQSTKTDQPVVDHWESHCLDPH